MKPLVMDSNGNPNGYNHSDHTGAVELARRLREYWLNRGYNIKTTVESSTQDRGDPVYNVRSDLKAGLPPEGAKVQVLAMDEAA